MAKPQRGLSLRRRIGGRIVGKSQAGIVQIASFFVAKCDVEDGDAMTGLRLQRLAFCAQGLALALHGKALFPEAMTASSKGPSSWVLDKALAGGTLPAYDPRWVSAEESLVLEVVWRVYGRWSGARLGALVRAMPPWSETPRAGVIEHKAMAGWFQRACNVADGELAEALAWREKALQ